MSSPSESGFGDSAQHVVVLAFDLVANQFKNLPTLIQNSLQTPAVQDAIKSALDDFLLKKMQTGTMALTHQDATNLGNAMTGVAGSKGSDALQQLIKQTRDYKKLEQSIKDFEAAAKSSPMGVFVDRNHTVVLVVGVGLAVGGAAALYATKTGGSVMNLVVGQLANKPLQIFKVGKLSLQGQLLNFQPEKKSLGAGFIATQKWEQLQVTLKLGLVATGTHVQKVSGDAILQSKELNLGLSGSMTPDDKTVNLALHVGLPKGPTAPLSIGIGAVITNAKFNRGTLDASLNTSYGDFGLQGQAGSKECRIMGTYVIHF